MSSNEDLATATPEESHATSIPEVPAHIEPTSASVDITQNTMDPPATQDPAVPEELPTAPPAPPAPPVPPVNADVRVTDTTAKTHHTRLTPEDCVSRLDLHITVSKPKLGEKLFQNGVHKYGEIAKTMISSLQDLGCEPRLAKEFSVLTLYDLVVFIGMSPS